MIQVMYDDQCRQTPRRECFSYEKTVCQMKPSPQPTNITWENQRLNRTEDLYQKKCEVVKRCNYTTEERIEQITKPKQVCEDQKLTQKVCSHVPVTEYKVGLSLL